MKQRVIMNLLTIRSNTTSDSFILIPNQPSKDNAMNTLTDNEFEG